MGMSMMPGIGRVIRDARYPDNCRGSSSDSRTNATPFREQLDEAFGPQMFADIFEQEISRVRRHMERNVVPPCPIGPILRGVVRVHRKRAAVTSVLFGDLLRGRV